MISSIRGIFKLDGMALLCIPKIKMLRSFIETKNLKLGDLEVEKLQFLNYHTRITCINSFIKTVSLIVKLL